MIAIPSLDPVVPLAVARLDASGRLIDAEPRLRALNDRAGGEIGAPLALPGVAAVAQLAYRLGIAISRSVVAADGEEEIDLWVRAGPDRGGVRLEVSGWRVRPAWRPAGDPAREGDFLSAAGDWLWETDGALRLTFLSPEAGQRHGFDIREMLGQPLTRLFALAQDDAGQLPILSAVSAQARFDGQHAEVRGTGRMVRLAATPRHDPLGRFAGFIGAARVLDGEGVDSPRPVSPVAGSGFPRAFGKRLERALRGPLARIIANADAIGAQGEGPIRGDYAGYAGDIASAGRHLLALVEDLVDLQAIERDDFAMTRSTIDLADVARRAAGLLAVRAGEAGVRIDRPGPDAVLRVRGEFRRALQVLVNLIGNALRYSPRGAAVWIRLESEGGMGCVIVADQGKGIALDDQARIFEKFARVDPAEPGGSGLGLYIARRLARAMGGDLIVDSAPGMGARFVLMLPLVEDPERPPPPAGAP
ncbi:PAS domain-containing sensor histidine kinase [Sphingomonas sp. ABOLD]|uniref:histidine kinase n=1 Tax=Sphingomonas trueperi TaxID=53317 RepID=A0A7X6BEB5_9SPHN|nr:ATP-binding protein [Sphingomonas sp. ABOLD]NJB98612.1 signal transduction histidine kinase [Sphingomonas trueperi]RSV44557.1 PAS domain-containing sensor histidine kinase [Sphingomonas sp. ABOLD]